MLCTNSFIYPKNQNPLKDIKGMQGYIEWLLNISRYLWLAQCIEMKFVLEKNIAIVIVMAIFAFVFERQIGEFLHGQKIPVCVVVRHHMDAACKIEALYLNDKKIIDARKGADAGDLCCSEIPRKWDPDYQVALRWQVKQIDAGAKEASGRVAYAKTYQVFMPIEKYKKTEDVCIHIFPKGKVRMLTGKCDKKVPKGYGADKHLAQGIEMPNDLQRKLYASQLSKKNKRKKSQSSFKRVEKNNSAYGSQP